MYSVEDKMTQITELAPIKKNETKMNKKLGFNNGEIKRMGVSNQKIKRRMGV